MYENRLNRSVQNFFQYFLSALDFHKDKQKKLALAMRLYNRPTLVHTRKLLSAYEWNITKLEKVNRFEISNQIGENEARAGERENALCWAHTHCASGICLNFILSLFHSFRVFYI